MSSAWVQSRNSKSWLVVTLVFVTRSGVVFEDKSVTLMKEALLSSSKGDEYQIEDVEIHPKYAVISLQYLPKISVSALVNLVKSITARAVNEKIEDSMGRRVVWKRDYLALSQGNVNPALIESYVKSNIENPKLTR